LEFSEKQLDGSYEVCGVDIQNQGELLKGLLYFPPKPFEKPYPIILYFHGFPQLFTLREIVKSHKYILDLGYSFFVFNFRGYRFSEGNVSIQAQVSDGHKIIEFVELMAKDNIFNKNDINIIGHDFGAFIALLICSQIKNINKIILVTPILDLRKHVFDDNFINTLNYINRFLPGNIRGISNVNEFINLTKKELTSEEYQIQKVVDHLSCGKLKIVIGEKDKMTPISEVKEIMQHSKIDYELAIINNMGHQYIDDEELEKLNKELINYFL